MSSFQILFHLILTMGPPQWLSGKESVCSADDEGDAGSIPGSGRSPGRRNGNLSSILAWKIPWTERPGGLRSIGSQGVKADSWLSRSQEWTHLDNVSEKKRYYWDSLHIFFYFPHNCFLFLFQKYTWAWYPCLLAYLMEL